MPTPARAGELEDWCRDATERLDRGDFDRALREAAQKAVAEIRTEVALSPEDAQALVEAFIAVTEAATRFTLTNVSGEQPPAKSTEGAALAPRAIVLPPLQAGDYAVPEDRPLTTFDHPQGYKGVDPFTTKLVPWLAASGPWSYSPENPPPPHLRDQWSNYALAMPSLLPGARHSFPFGRDGGGRSRLDDLLEMGREGRVKQIALHHGELQPNGSFTAPVAIYKSDSHYYLVQNGNYQVLPIESQPHLETTGEILLYRGIGPHDTLPVDILRAPKARENKLRIYQGLRQWYMHSRPDTSFGAAFDGSARSETNHLGHNISGLVEFRDFAKRFLTDAEIEDGEKVFGRMPRHTHNRWYSTPDPARLRFGPNVVAVRTDVRNLTFSADWNSEQEFHLVDTSRFTLDQATTPGVRPDYRPIRIP